MFLEQPLQLNILKILRNKILNRATDISSIFTYDEQEKVLMSFQVNAVQWNAVADLVVADYGT